MEILLSSVSPKQLLAGKVIGLGASACTDYRLACFRQFPIENGICHLGKCHRFVTGAAGIPDIGNCLFYSWLSAYGSDYGRVRLCQSHGSGRTTDVSSLYDSGHHPGLFYGLIMEHPENIVVKILTFIPITAPITVIARFGLSEIPIWELIVSIGILVLSIWGCFVLTTKLFRTYLLMYGKRPDLKEIIHSFKNA